MRVLLSTLNAKYIHTSLALRYLTASIKDEPGIEAIRSEFTINTPLEEVLGELYIKQPDVVAFSCYIWNTDSILQLVKSLKKVAPNIVFILGGPEVSYDTEKIMAENPEVDFIIKGEGEQAFSQLIKLLQEQKDKGQALPLDQSIEGVVSRQSQAAGENIKSTIYNIINELDEIASPYQGDLGEFKEKIAYLESARGCPYSCCYCLSGSSKGVRYFSEERIRLELVKLLNAQVKQVKFVDRTFNINKKHAMGIWRFILAEYERRRGFKTNFHFEISADLLDEEMLIFLAQVPIGLFQFEIGVQSTNEKTLAAINRLSNWRKLANHVANIREANNIHLHLDLIAGLPFEDMASFKQSFNDVMNLRPHRLQLGFLKLLKGTAIRTEADLYQYEYTSYAPYQVLQNKFMPFHQLLFLKQIEELLDKIYNSHLFYYTLDFIMNYWSDKFSFFGELLSFCQEERVSIKEIKHKDFFLLIIKFCTCSAAIDETELVRELLKLDLLRQQRLTQLPAWASQRKIPNFLERAYNLLNDPEAQNNIFPDNDPADFPRLMKQIHIEEFSGEIAQLLFKDVSKKYILFYYGSEHNPIIGGARFFPVQL
ncbi:MAG: DUF4080 domain-containing protein [Bacillota bacterium]|nr:DUF4080 domain-containing protein [Bacillota bacterium]